MHVPDRTVFFERVEAVFDGVPLNELPEDDLILSLSVAQYAADLALLEAERRGLVGVTDDGIPIVPYSLPEDADFIETILTRRHEWPPS